MKSRNEDTACDGEPYGTFTTLEEANEACHKNPNCKVIENKPCDSTKFQLCDVEVVIPETGSCTYEKGLMTKNNSICMK